MNQKLSKILILIFIARCFSSCDAVKRVAEDEQLLTNNTILINNKKDKTETINNLLYQKPNRKILGIPLRLHIYNTARPNRDSTFEAWLNKNPKRRERLKNLLSQKQVDKIKQSSIGFNNWLKTTGEAPVIIDEDRTKKSVKRLQDYHINNGWFDVSTTYSITKSSNKRAEIDYTVNTGKAFILDSITSKVASPIIDTLYKSIKKNSLIKPKEQYKTANFENERDRISNELRNSGIFHFNQDYVTFEIDTIGTNKKVNVGIQILDRAIRTPDSIKREPFKVYNIKEVNIITDYTFENRGKPFQDSIKYNSYTLYSYDKMRYRPKAITDAVFINPGTVFKDIDKTRTYRHLNELRTFKYPNIEYIENATIDFVKKSKFKDALIESTKLLDKSEYETIVKKVKEVFDEFTSGEDIGSLFWGDAKSVLKSLDVKEDSIPTGVHDLDDVLTGGAKRGTLHVVITPPNKGNSTLLVNVGKYAVLGEQIT